MKKVLSIILVFITVFGALSFLELPVAAEDDSSQDLTLTDPEHLDYQYCLLDDGTAEITHYIGANSIVEIPSQLGGYTVSSIGKSAFLSQESLTDVVIPDTVDQIGLSAFFNCQSLQHIELPNSIKTIDSFAFSDSGLKNIVIPDSVTHLSNSVFKGCQDLESAIIGKSVPAILCMTFSYCTSLQRVVIPDSVTYIGWLAFENCKNLTDVSFGDSVKAIDSNAFYSNTSLTSIKLPDSMRNIYTGAFSNCTSLKTADLGNNTRLIGATAFRGCTNLQEIVIPDSIKQVGTDAFTNTAWFNDQPDGIVYIGKCVYKAKGECPSDVSLLDGTLSISPTAFGGQYTMKHIDLPNSLTDIGFAAFNGCAGLTSIHIPQSVVNINEFAFYYCSSLQDIDISDHVSYIASSAFEGSLWYESQPDGVVYLGEYAFNIKGDNPDHLMIIDGSVYHEDDIVFYEANPIDTPDPSDDWYSSQSEGMYYAGTTAYQCKDEYGNGVPLNIILNENTTSIAPKAFCDCSDLDTVIIPDSVTSIGREAIFQSDGLKNITVPQSVSYLGAMSLGYTTYYEKYRSLDHMVYPYKIYGHKNSQAELYADDNGIDFVDIDHILIFGDANGDGEVTIVDATTIQRHLTDIPVAAFYDETADVDGDGSVTILDATDIQRYLIYLPASENIGKPISE